MRSSHTTGAPAASAATSASTASRRSCGGCERLVGGGVDHPGRRRPGPGPARPDRSTALGQESRYWPRSNRVKPCSLDRYDGSTGQTSRQRTFRCNSESSTAVRREQERAPAPGALGQALRPARGAGSATWTVTAPAPCPQYSPPALPLAVSPAVAYYSRRLGRVVGADIAPGREHAVALPSGRSGTDDHQREHVTLGVEFRRSWCDAPLPRPSDIGHDGGRGPGRPVVGQDLECGVDWAVRRFRPGVVEETVKSPRPRPTSRRLE